MNILGLDNIDPTTRALISMGSNLLQASGPSRMPISIGQALGGAMGNTMSTLDQATQMGIQNKLHQQEIEKNKMLLDQAKQHQEMMAQLPSILAPTIDVNPTGGPKNTQDTRAMALLSTGDPTLQTMGIKMLSGQGDQFGVTPIYGKDANGNPVILQLNKSGGINPVQMPGGVTPTTPMTHMDLGGSQYIFDPRGIAQPQTLPKSIPPQQQFENQMTYGTTGQGPEVTQNAPMPPMQKSTIDALPPKSQIEVKTKLAENEPKARYALTDTVAGIDSMETIVDQILNHPGLDKGTGMTGTALGKIPGTDAYNMQQLLFTLKSKTSIQTLQAMRQASASGGALGQISNYEDQMLANSINNLDAAQSKTQFVQQMKAFKSYLDGLKTRLSDAYNQTYSPIGKSYKESTKPNDVPQNLWDIMTPEEKAAWQ